MPHVFVTIERSNTILTISHSSLLFLLVIFLNFSLLRLGLSCFNRLGSGDFWQLRRLVGALDLRLVLLFRSCWLSLRLSVISGREENPIHSLAKILTH